MKKHSPLSTRQLLFATFSLLVFLGMTLFLFTYQRDEKRFANITTELFTDEMKSNTLNMHYNLASPENFGIYDYEPILACYDSDESLRSQAEIENTLAALKTLHTENLSETDAYLWPGKFSCPWQFCLLRRTALPLLRRPVTDSCPAG